MKCPKCGTELEVIKEFDYITYIASGGASSYVAPTKKLCVVHKK